MIIHLGHLIYKRLEEAFPELRVYIRSGTGTKFIRMKPAAQVLAWAGGAFFVVWAAVATAVVLMDSVRSGSLRDRAEREQRIYEERLNTLSAERDISIRKARDAQEHFNAVLKQVSVMQSALLASEDRREELEIGIELIQETLSRTIEERDAARSRMELAHAQLETVGKSVLPASRDASVALEHLTDALRRTAGERDTVAATAADAQLALDELHHEKLLLAERNDAIFSQLEDAVNISLEPFDKMFSSVGLSSSRVLEIVRRGYSDQSGPLRSLQFSTKDARPGDVSVRADGVLKRIDRLNLYRIAVEKTPFALPLNGRFRYSSGFGPRWGRMHYGTDMVAPHGTPILATADGVVTYAGWQGSYGRLVKIRHEFGLETRYAHLARIRVKPGQKVSRGDQIGDMGNTGRSTGTHLHYEVRDGGTPINPMTYIKAARNVF